jgi:integrase
VAKRPVKPLTTEQAKTLLKESTANRFHAVYVLALTTGMRQGELFGLQWNDIDLKAATLQVRHSLEEIYGTLRLKEPKSDSNQLTEGLASCPYVFPDTDGGLLRKCSFHRWSWSKIRSAAKLGDKVHFHDLRHSSASIMLADNVNIKAIQTILGHSTISMTMDTYAHLMPDAQRQAATSFDRLFG